MRLAPIAMSVVLLASAACGLTDPKPSPTGPTLLVINATCDPGPCVTFQVRGWEDVFVVPGQPPAGFIHLGQVNSASACLLFPSSVPFTLTEVDSLGRVVRTDTIFWTPKNSIGLTAATGGGFDPPFAVADSAIVPANAPGWRVTFPSGEVAPTKPCQP